MEMVNEADFGEARVRKAPVLVVRHGRGRTGGTTMLNWLIERARLGGREVLIGDGDRRNATLAGLYPPGSWGGAVQPLTDETADVKDWIRSLVGRMVEEKSSLVLDLGAGDQALAEACRELDLIAFCESVGVEPLFVGTMGPDMEDFDHLLTIFEAGFFRAEHMILVLNENLVRAGKTPAGAFDGILARPELIDLEGKSRIIKMSRFVYMEQTRRSGLNFYEVARGMRCKDGRPLDPLCQFGTRVWLDKLERECKENGVVEWLP